jgi:hypothetical protein
MRIASASADDRRLRHDTLAPRRRAGAGRCATMGRGGFVDGEPDHRSAGPPSPGEVLFGLERLAQGRRRTELETKAGKLFAILPCEPAPPGAAAATSKESKASHWLSPGPDSSRKIGQHTGAGCRSSGRLLNTAGQERPDESGRGTQECVRHEVIVRGPFASGRSGGCWGLRTGSP